MTPWFGLHLPNYTFPGTPPERMFERVVELVTAAEDAGFALVTVMDHFYQIRGVGPGDGADARGVLDAGGALPARRAGSGSATS